MLILVNFSRRRIGCLRRAILEHFVTLLLCRLDVKDRSLIYAAAGHQGYLVCADGAIKVLESTSIPLGFESHTIVPCGPTITFAPGDILVLLTDGIEEAESPDHRMFGLERALEVVAKAEKCPPLRSLKRCFVRHVTLPKTNHKGMTSQRSSSRS